MTDEVGKMLFPNDKCETFVREVRFKNLEGFKEKYYEFTAVKDTESKTVSCRQCDDWYSIIKAENEDDAWEKANKNTATRQRFNIKCIEKAIWLC